MRFNIDYDKESDDLFLYSEKNSKGSIEMGNLILDFDVKDELSAIEILNATNFLKDSIANGEEKLITNEFLFTLISADVETKQKNNFLFIKIILSGRKGVVSCPINAPLIEEPSPALAYA